MPKFDGGPHSSRRGDRLKQLRAFCHAARLGSISRAAAHVGSSQPSLSLQVRKLEEELGVALFLRSGPRISLTHAGERLYARAMPLVEGMDRLPAAFAESYHDVFSDVLVIGAGQTSAAYLLPRYVERFHEHWPEIRIEIRTGTGEQRLKWLRGYDLDLVVGSAIVAPPDIDFHPVLSSEFVLITAADHPLAGRESITVVEAMAYPFVAHPAARFASQVTGVILGLMDATPDVVVEVDGWSVITNYVAAGVGISFVPELCLTEHDGLWRISLGGALPPRRYGTMTRRDGILTLAARRFLDVMVAPRDGAP